MRVSADTGCKMRSIPQKVRNIPKELIIFTCLVLLRTLVPHVGMCRGIKGIIARKAAFCRRPKSSDERRMEMKKERRRGFIRRRLIAGAAACAVILSLFDPFAFTASAAEMGGHRMMERKPLPGRVTARRKVPG